MSHLPRLALFFIIGFVLLITGCEKAQTRSVRSTPSQTEAVLPDGDSKKLAILIGVSDYENMRGLRYTKNDILALKARLLKIGFKNENIFCLTCGGKSAERPSKERIENTIDSVLSLAGTNDVLWLALCGHGAELGGENKPRFCPVDAQTNNAENLKQTTILLEDIYKKLDQCRARFKLMTVDACRNDPFISRSTLNAHSLQTFSFPPKGCVLLYSCSENEISLEDDQFKQGLFSHYMIEGLDGQAAQDEKITVLGLIKYATEQTQRRATSLGKRQRPRLQGDLNDFILAIIPNDLKKKKNPGWQSLPRKQNQTRLTWTYNPDGHGELRLEKVDPNTESEQSNGEPFEHPIFPMLQTFKDENGKTCEIFDFRNPAMAPITQWAKQDVFQVSLSQAENVLLFEPVSDPNRRNGTRHAFLEMKECYRVPFKFSCDIADCDFGENGIAVFRLYGKPFGHQLLSLARAKDSVEKWTITFFYMVNKKPNMLKDIYQPTSGPFVLTYQRPISAEGAKIRAPLGFQLQQAQFLQTLKISRMEFHKEDLDIPITPTSGKEIFLADYPWETAEVGWERTHTDTFTSFSGRSFEKSIYAHAPSEYVYLLNKKWTRFTCTVGLRNEFAGDVYFIVRGDGRELWRSELATPALPEQELSLDISNINLLELIVDDAGNNSTNDHAIWFSPKLWR